MTMDDNTKMNITRSQLMDGARKMARHQMVSDRIYRNHLKTRFFNLQEQRKLGNTIEQLERLEQESWRSLDHKRKALETKSARITQAMQIIKVNDSPSITPRGQTAGKKKSYPSSASSSSSSTQSKRRRSRCLQRQQTWKIRKPSFSSLMNPYMTDDTEYRKVMGYAQHLTKKKTRKSSTMHESIADLDSRDMYHGEGQGYSKGQRKIFHGLKKSARGLISQGMIQTDQCSKGRRTGVTKRGTEEVPPPRRKISALPAPPTIEEDNARYIRVPGFLKSEDSTPVIHEAPEYSLLRRRSSVHDLAPGMLAPSRPMNLGRRGSRSLCEVEMKSYLPYLGRCPSPVTGLKGDFNSKLALFNEHVDNLTKRSNTEGYSCVPDDHTAPPPHPDNILPVIVNQGEEEEEEEEEEVVERPPPDRISVIDRFELSKWRQSMAKYDTLPVIKTCKYIRNPNKERYDPATNQYYTIDSEDAEDTSQGATTTTAAAPGSTTFLDIVKQAMAARKQEIGQ